MNGGDPIAELDAAATALEAAEGAVADRGEERVEAVADARRRVTDLLDRYEDRATGSGGDTFRAYVEFQERFADRVAGLDDDLLERDAFEAANEVLEKRRLTEADFERARERLSPASEVAALLEEREAAAAHYSDARRDVERRLSTVEERIDELESLLRLADVDLDAPVSRLRDPVEAYNASIRDAFAEFRREATARDLLSFVEATEAYPLVGYRQPPAELREYVFSSPAAERPVPTLIEYADYSTSKLDHYVDDPRELKTRVAVHRTYLERLDHEPLALSWPPEPATRLRFRLRELVSVVGRVAPDSTVARLREVRDLVRGDEYDRLRRAALARANLDEEERERIASGAVEADLADARRQRERLAEALEAHPPR